MNKIYQMNRSKPYTYIFLLPLLVTACNPQQVQTPPSLFAPKVVEAKGYVVPRDSMSEPKVVLVGKPKVVKVGNPRVVPTNTNIHLVGVPKVVKVGTPRVCIPGQDGFLLPKTMPAISHPFDAGIPEIVIAKDPYVKDINPQNFNSFGKLQGLKHGYVSCMLQDRNGNLWFGTPGGVSKYDGQRFTHYTEKEGLVSNLVWSILEDKSGNRLNRLNSRTGLGKSRWKWIRIGPKRQLLSKNTLHANSAGRSGKGMDHAFTVNANS